MRAIDLRHSAQKCTFGTRLRASREHAQLTQEKLAEAAGVTHKRVVAWEIGGSSPPEPQQVSRMASAMKVNSLWLMAGDLAGSSFRPVWYRQSAGGAA